VRKIATAAVVALVLVPLSAAEPKPGSDFTRVGNQSPAWSPDGREVAFAGYAARHPQIYVIDVEGKRVRRVTHDSAHDYAALWRPDGQLFFVGQEDFKNFVGTLDARGRTVKVPLAGDVDWSPDSRRIVYTRMETPTSQGEIWVANTDGSEARMIAAGAAPVAWPDWSPDGQRIAYTGLSTTGKSTLHVVGADGSGDTEITHGPQERFPDWSPDGKRIVYAEGDAQYRRLAIVNSDGTNTHDLTCCGTEPVWSPDGKLIAFGSYRSGNSEIWLIRPDGSGLQRLTFGGCTIIGTDGTDRLIGGRGRDVICGFDGNDLLSGGGGSDKLVAGPGDDRIDGGNGNDGLYGEQGDDRLVAGAGRDRLDGGSGADVAYADSRDLVYGVEQRYGGRAGHPIVLPTAAEIEQQTRAGVRASRAHVSELIVQGRSLYALTISVPDPAAYLHYRVNTALHAIFKAIRFVQFRRFDFAVRGKTTLAFSYSLERLPDGLRSTWYVRPDLINCVEGIDLDIEVNPDGGGPPCPA
jgi:hypothetical protein